MSYYNSSAARELPILDTPEVTTSVAQKTEKTRLRIAERTTHENLAFINFRTIVMFFAVVGCICVMLQNQAKLNEINRQISSMNSEITQLQSEYVKMQSNLDSTMSRRNVARQAEQELGMQRVDPNQIIHIHIYEEDRVEVVNSKEPQGFSENVESFAATIVQTIKNIFSAA